MSIVAAVKTECLSIPIAAHRTPRRYGRSIVMSCRLLAAGILVAAALAKLAAHPPPLFLVLLSVELLVALLLLAHGRSVIIGSSAVLFTLFAMVSTYKMATGRANCGCFGELPSDPRLVATMDLSLAIALASCVRLRRNGRSVYAWVSTIGICASGIAAAVIVSQWIAVSYSSTAASDITGKVVRLDVEHWVGHPFPIGKYLRQPQPQLASGRRLVVIFDPECPRL